MIGEIVMHSIFCSSEYLPQQMLIYIFNYSAGAFATLFMLNSKFSKIKTFLLSLLILYISLFPKHFDNLPVWINQIILLFLPVCVILLYKEKLRIKLISSIISLLIILGTDYFSYFMTVTLLGCNTNYAEESLTYLISVITLAIFLFTYVFIWNRFYRNNVNMFFKNNLTLLFIFIFTELIFVCFLVTEFTEIWKFLPNNLKNANRSFLLFYIFIFLVVDIVIIYFTKSSSKYHKIKVANEMLEYQNKLQAEYYNKILENYDKTAKLRHDINNLVQVINIQLLDNTADNHTNAKKIADEIANIMDSTKTRSFCDNKIINTVLFDKTAVAEKNSIKIVDNIILGEDTGISDFDLCRVFINLLDNAINALIEYEENQNKTIFISGKISKGYVYIKCENPSSKNQVIPKQESSLHGYGLKIIKDISEKYNGSLITKNQNSVFSVLVALKSN